VTKRYAFRPTIIRRGGHPQCARGGVGGSGGMPDCRCWRGRREFAIAVTTALARRMMPRTTRTVMINGGSCSIRSTPSFLIGLSGSSQARSNAKLTAQNRRPVRSRPVGVTTRKCSECTTSWTKHERAARWYGRSTRDGCRSGGGRSHVSGVPRAYAYRASPQPPQSTLSRPSPSGTQTAKSCGYRTFHGDGATLR
jgi:hypothetical protein